MSATLRRYLTRMSGFVLMLLIIELLDEILFGAREAAWPLIRNDLGLTYVQIGLLTTVPTLLANVVEPAIGILGDTWKRRTLIVIGGIVFGLTSILMALSSNFGVLMLVFIVMFPASGAFVSLSQVALMDHAPQRHEQNMARWTLAGSVGQVIGPILLGLSVAVGGGWRALFILIGVVSIIMAFMVRRSSIANGSDSDEETIGFVTGLRLAVNALRRRDVLRWLVLLEFSNLILDILLGYLALYFVDVVHVSETQAGIAVAIFTGVGLIGDALLIPLLERIRGLDYLRVSAVIELFLFAAFMLVDSPLIKMVIIGMIGFFNAGWYAILQGQFYSAMPGQGGAVMALSNVSGILGGLFPIIIGLLAEHFGLGIAMWFILLGPIALIVGLPRTLKKVEASNES
ncbi:MAG: MFS transporter [Anaerolineaceae bacterium]|nr:MFS transporter [Anaerolineaceae bacterium]